jgi:hypothetical protein
MNGSYWQPVVRWRQDFFLMISRQKYTPREESV